MFRNQSNQKATQNKKFKTIFRSLLQKVAVVLYFVGNFNSFWLSSTKQLKKANWDADDRTSAEPFYLLLQ